MRDSSRQRWEKAWVSTRGCRALSHPSINTPFSTFECLPSNGNLNVGNDDRIYSKFRNLGIRKLGSCRNISVFLTGKETSSSISFAPLLVFRARKPWLQQVECWAVHWLACSRHSESPACLLHGCYRLSFSIMRDAFLLHHERCSCYNRYVEMIESVARRLQQWQREAFWQLVLGQSWLTSVRHKQGCSNDTQLVWMIHIEEETVLKIQEMASWRSTPTYPLPQT